MSRLFPHPAYAEDQPLSKTILTTHVMYRGLQSGAFVGILSGSVRSLLVMRRSRVPVAAAIPNAAGMIQRHSGVGALIGVGLMVIGLPARMWGRQDIEWRDRSWRLLENAGQMEVDDWSLVGTALGAAYAVATVPASDPSRFIRILGGTGIGSMTGVAGYMVWRYGIRGGKQ